MDRRTAIRKAFGLSVTAVALPTIAKVMAAEPASVGSSQCNAPYPTGCPIEVAPPPPDTRTPEQVITDQDKEQTEDIIRHLTREPDVWSKRYAYSVWSSEFDRALAACVEQRIAITETTVNGYDVIVGPNGNVVRRIGKRIYLG